jgi:hypothetical protein
LDRIAATFITGWFIQQLIQQTPAKTSSQKQRRLKVQCESRRQFGLKQTLTSFGDSA